MTRAEYADYLLSKHWQRTRARALYMAQNRCQSPLCWLQRSPAQHRVEVHHLTYERLGREWADDLIVLCVECHRRQHGLKVELPPDKLTFAEVVGMIADRVRPEP